MAQIREILQGPVLQMLDSYFPPDKSLSSGISNRETNCVINHWTESYPVDSIIHLLNNSAKV